ncbi:MAG TPA: tRNA (adenosine(37)-N6)-threonylcarbamoyltransferase complex dimerization subunit type 1 TsaB [Dongiaceae bacterium]|nr:tRNA (adenosine(37)-N6)-threonylcarbamoyltransferase complex dimerization subunit type 1 TsaB [Dongiaceae bacterium]
MKQPTLLALDTSSEACSVALQMGDQVLHRFTDQPRKHAELILPLVDEVLAEAGLKLTQLDALCFGRGPGSFTGLRIAAGTVQGLAFGADLPVIPVSSLAGLAQRAVREFGWSRIHAAFDARMGEVYWGSYQLNASGELELSGRECVCVPARLADAAGIEPDPGWCGAGSGWTFRAELEDATGPLQQCEPALLPHARDLLPLASRLWQQGQCISAEQVVPVYLRNDVAVKSAPRNTNPSSTDK